MLVILARSRPRETNKLYPLSWIKTVKNMGGTKATSQGCGFRGEKKKYVGDGRGPLPHEIGPVKTESRKDKKEKEVYGKKMQPQATKRHH